MHPALYVFLPGFLICAVMLAAISIRNLIEDIRAKEDLEHLIIDAGFVVMFVTAALTLILTLIYGF